MPTPIHHGVFPLAEALVIVLKVEPLKSDIENIFINDLDLLFCGTFFIDINDFKCVHHMWKIYNSLVIELFPWGYFFIFL
jgi:hypothetical protein